MFLLFVARICFSNIVKFRSFNWYLFNFSRLITWNATRKEGGASTEIPLKQDAPRFSYNTQGCKSLARKTVRSSKRTIYNGGLPKQWRSSYPCDSIATGLSPTCPNNGAAKTIILFMGALYLLQVFSWVLPPNQGKKDGFNSVIKTWTVFSCQQTFFH